MILKFPFKVNLNAAETFSCLKKQCIKVMSTCQDWNWHHRLGHCVRGESLTHWPSSRPWSSPARHQTPCQSDLSLQAEERGTFEFLLQKADDIWCITVSIDCCTCRRLDLAEFFRSDAPHPDCGVSKASGNQARVICHIHSSQTLQASRGEFLSFLKWCFCVFCRCGNNAAMLHWQLDTKWQQH